MLFDQHGLQSQLIQGKIKVVDMATEEELTDVVETYRTKNIKISCRDKNQDEIA